MRVHFVLFLSVSLLSTAAAPARAKASSIMTTNQALHEQCRLAIEHGTPFTTEERIPSLKGPDVTVINASIEEMEQAQEGRRPTKPLKFLNLEEFQAEVSWGEVTAPTVVTTMFNDYVFRIARAHTGTFVQALSAGKTCGTWSVKDKKK
jgi:hypothetical protein